MPSAIDTPPAAASPPGAVAIDQLRARSMHPAGRRATPGRHVAPGSPPRSLLAEITLAHGQLEVVAARLALMATRPDLGPDHMDVLDAAHQTRRALLSVSQARTHIEATTSSHPLRDDRPDRSNPHAGSADSACPQGDDLA
jgi:hypothetical protein